MDNDIIRLPLCVARHIRLKADRLYWFFVEDDCDTCKVLAREAEGLPRFSVVEYSSYYAVQDNDSGKEHVMGDGVDTLFDAEGKAISPGTENFRVMWEMMLNEDENETERAYFS